MEELINIALFCDTILVRHGQYVDKCNAVYINEEDVIQFSMTYHKNNRSNKTTYQYIINSYNFIITDTEVNVIKEVINDISEEINKRLYQ